MTEEKQTNATAPSHGYKPGMVVKVHLKIKETNTKGEEKERIQIYEGTIIAMRHGTEAGATITVRKISEGIGVEKIFPINSPVVVQIEVVKQFEVRRAKLNHLRDRKFKRKMTEVKK
ncbi:MAG: 50S ribosomal protein L19 [bacterium]|nr:50S ribosomal protein L19 [bacterium]